MATYSRKRPLSQTSSSSPLTSISANTVTSSSQREPTSSMPANKKPRLTQMTLDLGQKVHTRCQTCSMDYILSSDEDRRLHKKFHDAFVEDSEKGVPLTKAILKRGRVVARFAPRKPGASHGKKDYKKDEAKMGMKRFFNTTPVHEESKHCEHRTRTAKEQAAAQDTIIEIRHRDHWTLKQFAQRVLSVAENELGAVPIEKEQLWECFWRDFNDLHERLNEELPISDTGKAVDRHALLMQDRYRVYVYVHEERAVGLLLAERIREGRAVVDGEKEEQVEAERQDDFGRKKRKTMDSESAVSSSEAAATTLPTPPPSSPPLEATDSVPSQQPKTLIASTTPTPALLGISRIWVLRPFRSQSIASALLATAPRKMPYGSEDVGEMEDVSEAFARGETPTGITGESATTDKNGIFGYEKPEIAFSQPTEAGRRLAERWWGGRTGWLVYD